jgi:hypothetical protein
VNIGVNREDISSAHMTYFYDEDICFTRLGFPHMLSAHNVPPGAGSIQAEVYFSEKYKPLTSSPEEWIEPVLTDLRRCGIVRDDDQVLSRKAMLLRYANVIFDLDRAASLETVHGYLDDLGIAYCGRYGDWGYMWTDESFKSGEVAAERALSAQMSRGRRMIQLSLDPRPGGALKVLCLGCHADDIEIGCGGTILRLTEQYPQCEFHWVVFSAIGSREAEAQRGAELFAGPGGYTDRDYRSFPTASCRLWVRKSRRRSSS